MGDMQINLNPQQFNLGDGGPSHVAPGPKKHRFFSKSDRALKDHIFNHHVRSTDAGKIFPNAPEGIKTGIEWHDALHAQEAFEWRNEHTHE